MRIFERGNEKISDHGVSLHRRVWIGLKTKRLAVVDTYICQFFFPERRIDVDQRIIRCIRGKSLIDFLNIAICQFADLWEKCKRVVDVCRVNFGLRRFFV